MMPRCPEWPDFKAGKTAFLDGLPFTPPNMSSERTCEWRKGWLSAEVQRNSHPEWGRRFIISHDGFGLKCWE